MATAAQWRYILDLEFGESINAVKKMRKLSSDNVALAGGIKRTTAEVAEKIDRADEQTQDMHVSLNRMQTYDVPRLRSSMNYLGELIIQLDESYGFLEEAGLVEHRAVLMRAINLSRKASLLGGLLSGVTTKSRQIQGYVGLGAFVWGIGEGVLNGGGGAG